MKILKQPGLSFYLRFIILFVWLAPAHALQDTGNAALLPDDNAQFQQAVDLSQQQNWVKAAELFRQIAERHPQWPEPKNNLAVALMNMGQVEQAQQALEDAVSSVPVFKTAHDNRKRIYDYLAAISYGKALGETAKVKQPELNLLLKIEEAEPVVINETPAVAIQQAEQKQAEQPLIVADDSIIQIKQHLLAWSRAWSVSDVEQYFAAYSKQFKPDEPGKDYTQWHNSRRVRLKMASDTRVSLEKTAIYLDSAKHNAVVEFVQDYRSNTYHDRVLKQLLMTREDNNWLILSERVIQQLSNL